MRIGVTKLLVALTLIAGCGETTQHASDPTAPTNVTLKAGSPRNGDEDRLEQPPDAVWTIICTQINGTAHVERAKVTKQQLVAMTGLQGFYIVHDESASTLYYGFYRSIDARPLSQDHPRTKDDVKEGARAQADLARIKGLHNQVGDPIFPMAGMSPLEPVDPAAPAEWDLRNVDRNKPDSDPTKAFWSLEIAVYKDSPQRKQAAVDSVRELREKMKIPDAYFFHGKTSSSVCIGTWPRGAVKEQESDRVESSDPNQPLLVLPQRLPTGASADIHDANGNKLTAMAPRLDAIDPTLIEAMVKYDRRSVNGYDIKHTYNARGGGVVERYDPSLVIFIPRDDNGGLLGNSQRQIDSDTSDGTSLLNPNAGRTGGQLRSIDSGAGR